MNLIHYKKQKGKIRINDIIIHPSSTKLIYYISLNWCELVITIIILCLMKLTIIILLLILAWLNILVVIADIFNIVVGLLI